MEQSNHLHTHAHKTQTYWPSQANNKLIWAISVHCGGTTQQDQTGAAASSLRQGPRPPSYFSCPCCLALLVLGRVDIRATVSGADSSLHLWHPAHDRRQIFKQRQQERRKKNVCFAMKQTVSWPCVLPLMNNNSAVWHGFHGYTPPTPTPETNKQKNSCQTLYVDPIMCPTGHLGKGRIILSGRYGEMNA